MLFGAAIAKAVDWRAAFVVIGLAGVVIAPIFRLVVKEPPRLATPAGAAPLSAVFAVLARKPSFWLMAFASAASSTAGYGPAFWVPSILIQAYGFDLATTSYFYGSLLLVGGATGGLSGRRPGRQSWASRIAGPTPGSRPSPGWSPRPCSSPASCRRRLSSRGCSC